MTEKLTDQDQDQAGLFAAATTSSAPGRRQGGKRRTGKRLTGLYIITFAGGIGIWMLLARFGNNPLTPSPLGVVNAFGKSFADGSLWQNTLASVERVVIGFLLGVAVAIPAGFLMGWYRWARGLLEPWVQFFRTVPPLALIPLVIVFLGIGEEAKIFVIFLASFLTCVIAAFQGVLNVDMTLINAARVLGAKDMTIFMRVVVPASLPMIFIGMRVGLGSAWATLVASELIGAQFGLGRMMQQASQYLDTSVIVEGIIMIGALGFIMDRSLMLIERRMTRWQEIR